MLKTIRRIQVPSSMLLCGCLVSACASQTKSVKSTTSVSSKESQDAVSDVSAKDATASDTATTDKASADADQNSSNTDQSAQPMVAGTRVFTEPKSVLKEFKKLDDTSAAEAWYQRGLAHRMLGDAQKAAADFQSALNADPLFAPAVVGLARVADVSTHSALKSSMLTRDERTQALPHLFDAVRAYDQGDTDRVEREARAALQADERLVEAMRLMGYVFTASGRFEAARFALENALVLAPGHAQIRYDYGHVLLKLKEKKLAKEQFYLASSLNPEFVEAVHAYGVLSSRDIDIQPALAALQNVVERRPKVAAYWSDYASALRAGQRYEDAKKAYEKAIALESSYLEAKFNLGLLYMDNELSNISTLERYEMAQSLFGETTSQESLESRSNEYLGVLRKKIKREKKKIERDKRRKEEEAREAAEEQEAESEQTSELTGDNGADSDTDSTNEEEEVPAKGDEAAAETAVDAISAGSQSVEDETLDKADKLPSRPEVDQDLGAQDLSVREADDVSSAVNAQQFDSSTMCVKVLESYCKMKDVTAEV